HLSTGTSWAAAWAAAWAAGRDAAWDAAWAAAEGAAEGAAEAATRDATRDAAWTAGRAAGEAAILHICAGLPLAQHHLAHFAARWEVWRKGYALLCDVGGRLYVYAPIGLGSGPVGGKRC
ncbi:MAG TPA: hypothetical protein VI542_34975, partial [Candidatus Tectomicrobia bacterium]